MMMMIIKKYTKIKKIMNNDNNFIIQIQIIMIAIDIILLVTSM